TGATSEGDCVQLRQRHLCFSQQPAQGRQQIFRVVGVPFQRALNHVSAAQQSDRRMFTGCFDREYVHGERILTVAVAYPKPDKRCCIASPTSTLLAGGVVRRSSEPIATISLPQPPPSDSPNNDRHAGLLQSLQ